ncbi:hypothetical protein KIM67_10205 [Flagellimonas sp. 389]|uniref:hypothetical protein n=1 Tax=Flagellimonas sp. 389 TaxID=2835862 RepID=UPI001BD679B1|nr:hypothetical protein [Flagellimonas sp. 389]MBS9462785.1 hypothetical protein [Flagellimonas sp. 389]
MIEFLTEWSMDDPKWLVIFILIGGWVFWSQLSFTLKHGYNSWLEKPHGFNNWIRAIGGLLMFLYGLIELLRRLYLVVF